MEHHSASHQQIHISSLRSTYVVFGLLMGLLALTVAVAYLDLGAIGLLIALLIASLKAALIILYFMHVRHAGKLQALFAFAAFLWLAILILITASDYLTRVGPGQIVNRSYVH